MHTALKSLQIIPIRYRRSVLASGDERSIDAFAASGVYQTTGLPTKITEPNLPADLRTADEPYNIGLLGDRIAEVVATARQRGDAIMMTGGDCTHITGVIGGLQDVHGPALRIGLVWFDVHGDFNTPDTSESGMLGGMPVAVCAGLAFPRWRELSHIVAPLPTERILMVDVRNLDSAESQLINATSIQLSSIGNDLPAKVSRLAEQCDCLYLHIDSDILDQRYTPTHATKEPNGPDMAAVLAAIDVVMATGKVATTAVVSVYGEGEGSSIMIESGLALIRGCLTSWQKHGMA